VERTDLTLDNSFEVTLTPAGVELKLLTLTSRADKALAAESALADKLASAVETAMDNTDMAALAIEMARLAALATDIASEAALDTASTAEVRTDISLDMALLKTVSALALFDVSLDRALLTTLTAEAACADIALSSALVAEAKSPVKSIFPVKGLSFAPIYIS
jgi:hypothetical protein